MGDSKVVLTLFSTKGPIPTSAWETLDAEVLSLLARHLSLSRPSPSSCAYLDSHPTSPPSPSHRVRQFVLDVDATDATQPALTAAARRLLPSLSAFGLEAVLTPLQPFHRSTLPAARDEQRPTGLAVFDMDSTLIQQEVIDELARSLGLYGPVAAITEAAMRGEAPYTDFAASLRARVALLEGVEPDVWDRLKRDVITFTPGATELVACLAADGWKTAVLSGGFVDLATWVRDTLGLDHAFANELETDAVTGRLTGRVKDGTRVVDGDRKRELMLEIAAREGVVGPDARVMAVGDGSNDLPMMGAAGLGVAFCAKPKVQERAPAAVNGRSLVDVLYVLGWTDGDIKEVMERS